MEIELEIEAVVARGAFDAFGVGVLQPDTSDSSFPNYLFLIRYQSNEAEVYFNDTAKRKVAPAPAAERNHLRIQLADQHVVNLGQWRAVFGSSRS